MAKTLGQQLKQIRESQGISLEEIAQQTHIRLVYLKAIEAGNDEAVPSPTQLRGFLRLYAGELGVSIDDLTVNEDQGPHEISPGAQDSQTPQEDAPEQPQEIHDSEPLSDKVDSSQQSSDSELFSDEADQHQEEPASMPTNKNAQVGRKAQRIEPESFPESAAFTTPDQENKNKLMSPGLEVYRKPQTSEFAKDLRSDQIFKEIGENFKDRRELISLSLDDINESLHIQKHYLEAIEAGKFDRLPSTVQAKGMLTNYAEFLNLDVEEVLLKYANGLQLERIEKQPIGQTSKSTKEFSRAKLRLKNFFSLDLLIISVLFVSFAAFVIWGVNRILAAGSTETSATDLPEVAEILLATGSPTPQLSPTLDETALAGEPDNNFNAQETPLFTPAASTSPINVVLIPRQRTWVQVIVDFEIVFEGRLLPGNAYDFSGQETVEILTGNAGSLQVYFNDQDLGSPGLLGQVANMIFTESGLVLPTPTNTPTITETPETTPTPSVTPSLTPTISENNG